MELSVIAVSIIKIIRDRIPSSTKEQAVQNQVRVTVERSSVFAICEWIKSKGFRVGSSIGMPIQYPDYDARAISILSKDPVFGVRKRFKSFWYFIDGGPLFEQFGVLHFESRHNGADDTSWVFDVHGEINLAPMTSLMNELSNKYGIPVRVRLLTITRKSEHVVSGY